MLFTVKSFWRKKGKSGYQERKRHNLGSQSGKNIPKARSFTGCFVKQNFYASVSSWVISPASRLPPVITMAV